MKLVEVPPQAPPAPPADDDVDLPRAIAGDTEAFGRIVERHQRRLMGLALHLLRDVDEADSAVQDGFLKAWTSLPEFRRECPLGAWLARIVANGCRDRLKRKRLVLHENELPEPAGDDGPEGPLALAAEDGPDPERRAASEQLGRRIREEMASLPRMQREVFALRFFDDRPLAEIASLLSLDLGTIKTHLFRATRRVRKALEKTYGNRLPI